MLRAKRVYDKPERADGTRVLVMAKRCHGSLLSAALGAALALSFVAAPAVAEHEAQYRYTVLGFVKDAAGKPRTGVGLEVTRQKTGLSYQGETDASGLYVIVTRLADESRGERLLVRAGPAALWVTTRFDPTDHKSERGTRVDFTGPKPAERPELFAATLKQFLSK